MATAATQKKQKAYEDFMQMHESITGRTTKGDSDDRLIDSFLIDSQNYIRESADRAGSIGWKDSQDTGMQDNRTHAADVMAQRAAQVRRYLDSHQGQMDQGRYQMLDSYLKGFDSDLQKVGKAFQDKEQYYAQWDSEEAYNQAKKAQMQQAMDSTVVSTMPTGAKRQHEAAQKAYDDYLNSEEYRANQLQKMVNQSIAATKASGISTYATGTQGTVSQEVDNKEKELRAVRDYYKRLYDAEEDNRIMATDLAEFEKWPEEDKLKLNVAIENGIGSMNMFVGLSKGNALAEAATKQKELEAKYGVDVVQRMMKSVSRSKNAKITEEAAALGKQTGDEHAVMGSAATVPMGLVGSIAAPVGYLSEAVRGGKGQYSTLDPNNIGNLPNVYSGAVRGQVAENIAGDEYDEQGNKVSDGGALRQVLSYAYQGGMSLADSLARLAVGGEAGSLGLAALSSFGQTMSEASKQGATPQQAVVLAVGTAALEAATEKIPLDEMLKAAKGGAKGAMAIAGEALKQAGIEATTEEISLFGSLLLEAGVLREKSSYNQQIGAAIANGATYDEAKAQADKAIWNEALQTAAVSGFSGLFSGGGSAAVGSLNSTDAQTLPQTEQTAETAPETAVPQIQEQTEVAPKSMEQQIADDMANRIAGKKEPAQPETAVQVKEHISMEDYANNNSPVWRNVAYEDNTTKAAITQQIHDDMVANGNVVQVQTDVADGVDQAFPDLRGTKKAERTPILKQAFSTLKNNLRTFLNGFNGQNFEFEVNGKVLDAKLYNTGIKEVLEKVTKEKAKMLYSTESIFKNAQYLYSTPDYDGDPNVYRWNYFYTPVKIGDDVVGVRIAVRDVANPQESQIYNWNIKKDAPLGDVGRGKDNRIPSGASSDTSTNILQQNGTDVKGTGAAESNFSGKAQYQDLLYEGNVHPDRASDVRPMEVPKTDLEGNPVSATAANTYGSQYTTDDLASAEESAIAEGKLSYMKVSNDTAAERASKTIEGAGGWGEAYRQWHDEVRDGKTSAEMAARGAMLLNHAAEVYEQTKATGDEKATKKAKQEWLSILMDIRELGTNTAQGLQAMRMIHELAPPDKLDFAVASIKRMVSNMKLQEDVKIDENLLNEYRMAETDEQRNEIMSQIQQNVADQIPSTWLDKWTALRYMNMLGNLKTNIRNVAGNVGSAITYRMKDQTAALMEDIIHAVNKNYQRTKSHTVSKELMDFAREDFNKIKAVVNAGGKYNDRMAADGEFQQGVMDRRTIFKSNAKNETVKKIGDTLMKPLEGYRKGTNWMMNNQYFGDEAFGRAAYARALAGYLKANGVKDTELSNVSSELMDGARAYAIQEAQEATFKDNTALANIVTSVQKSTGVVGQAIMPFTKTPANVLVRATEFSPLGILDTAVKTAKMGLSNTDLAQKSGMLGDIARSGEQITGADIVNSLAKTMTGSALFVLGAALYNQGFLSAGPDDDEKKEAFDDLNGKQPYSLQFMGEDSKIHSYTLDWLTPVAMPMFMGAEFWKMMQETDGERTFADYEQLFTSIADPMIQMSMLQGLNDTLESIKWSDNNLGQFFINAAINYLTQGVTNTLIGQLEKTTEENRMTTYVDKDSEIPTWAQQALGKTSQKIPIWDFQQMEYQNAWGETEQNEGGLLYNLLSTGYLSEEDQSELTKELNRVYAATKENVFPKSIEKTVTYTDSNGIKHDDYNLSQGEFETMQRTTGQMAKQILEQVINSSDYQKMTDVQKAYTLQAVYDYAQEQGKKAALPNYYSKADAWISKTKATDTGAFITQGAKRQLNSVIGDVLQKMDDGFAIPQAAKDNMDSVWKSYSAMSQGEKDMIMDTANSDTKKYLQIREAGVSDKKYLQLMEAMDSIVVESGHSNPRAVQKAETIAGSRYLSEGQKVELLKIEMSDAQDENLDAVKSKGYSAADYAKMFRDYEGYTRGKGKKDRTVEKWMKDYKISYNAAKELYEIFS